MGELKVITNPEFEVKFETSPDLARDKLQLLRELV